ncbi:hypothetical protein EK21DRAFT_90024 [Setomelanomma holmii]|uniref:Uncharacterized protein n=1 Tax=Setomelanomma holmii TaxID=210430 RepID=A0A9P4H6M7_9PLEO|nr:hypothetical protein EK21DRAFT_90024 [Setomelanomma holmii]
MTYEHAIAHEFMHLELFAIDRRDVNAPLRDHAPWEDIYGDQNCHLFAMHGGGKPNGAVVTNADKYAWTYYWFDKEWGWRKGKHDGLKKGDIGWLNDDDLTFQTPEIDFPEPSFPVQEEDIKLDLAIILLATRCQPPRNQTAILSIIASTSAEIKTNGKTPLRNRSSRKEDASSLLAHKDCNCKCDDKDTSLADSRCAGFAGVTLDGLLLTPTNSPEAPKPTPTPSPAPTPSPSPNVTYSTSFVVFRTYETSFHPLRKVAFSDFWEATRRNAFVDTIVIAPSM